MFAHKIKAIFPRHYRILKLATLMILISWTLPLHATSTGPYSDQAERYYTGGEFTSRNSSNSLRPLRLSLPHIGGGSRAFDVFFGKFEFSPLILGSRAIESFVQRVNSTPKSSAQAVLKGLTFLTQIKQGFKHIFQALRGGV